MKKLFTNRKIFFIMGISLFVLEIGLLIWPFGLASEDTIHFLSGEEMWLEEISGESHTFYQKFCPQYAHIKSIGFYLAAQGDIPKGDLIFYIRDKNGILLYERELSYAGIAFNHYTDVTVDLTLKTGESYFWGIECYTDSASKAPLIGVCPSGIEINENASFYHTVERTDGQLLARYHYINTIPLKKAGKILALCLVTALGLCFGLPRNFHVRKMMQILLFLTVPAILGYNLEYLTANPAFLSHKALCQHKTGIRFCREYAGYCYLAAVFIFSCIQIC